MVILVRRAMENNYFKNHGSWRTRNFSKTENSSPIFLTSPIFSFICQVWIWMLHEAVVKIEIKNAMVACTVPGIWMVLSKYLFRAEVDIIDEAYFPAYQQHTWPCWEDLRCCIHFVCSVTQRITSREEVAIRTGTIYSKHVLLICCCPQVAVSQKWLPMFTGNIEKCLSDTNAVAAGFSLFPGIQVTWHRACYPHVERWREGSWLGIMTLGLRPAHLLAHNLQRRASLLWTSRSSSVKQEA